jgi:hypothetical protein
VRLVIAMVVVGGLGVAAQRASAEDAPAGRQPAANAAPGAKAPAGSSKRAGEGSAETPRGGAATPAAQDLARALVSNEDWSRVLDEYASGLAGHVAESLSARGDAVPDDLEASIRKQLGQELPYQHVVDAQAQALAKQLSPDELKKAASFYASPLGKKVTQGVPKAQSELGHDLQARLSTAVPQIVRRVAPKAMAGEAPGRDDAGKRGTGSTAAPSGEGAGGPQRPPPSSTPGDHR